MISFETVRNEILKYLWDVKTGKITLEKDTGFGTHGVTLFNELKDSLSALEFIAQLEYLEDKGMVERKPPEMPLPNTREEKLELAWYNINSYGIDIIEGHRTDPGLPNIQQIVNIRDITSNHSNINIGEIATDINTSIKHNDSNEIERLLAELSESLECIPTSEERKGVQRLLETMKLELSNPEPDQDKEAQSSLLRRLKSKLEPYQIPLSLLASLATILKGLGS